MIYLLLTLIVTVCFILLLVKTYQLDAENERLYAQNEHLWDEVATLNQKLRQRPSPTIYVLSGGKAERMAGRN